MEAKLRQFLADHQAINHSAFAREIGIDRMDFAKIVKGLRRIPRPRRGDFLKTMRKYGFSG